MGPKGYLIRKYETHRLIVTGYDTCLPKDVVRTALVEHFSSCGEIVQLSVLEKTCLVFIRGPDAVEKAMELNNGGCKCHVQGCKIVVDKVMIRSPDTEPYISWPSRGPGAVEKAVELNNGGCKCHVEGCKIVVDKVMVHDPDPEPFTWGFIDPPPCRWVPSQEGQD
ncbi:unnamed protein product [Arabis nemorensis]|uniref:RRM domain-containing protein n=1 Tax=Arabis nemorensis TaxID=586526 RepID=A0A565CIT5_9BRAS|nr:unnamed protein product [Arabis nemorensis]